MGLFDFFKKEKEIVDLTVQNLSAGCILEYDLQSWIVKDKTEYDWGNNQFSFEYTIENGSVSSFLHVNTSPTLKLDVSSEIKMFDLGRDVKQTIVETDSPPKKIVYKGTEYFLSDEFLGHCKSVNDDDEDWSKFVNWVFNNGDESEFISLNRWSETEIDGVQGRYAKEFEFSNFLSSPEK